MSYFNFFEIFLYDACDLIPKISLAYIPFVNKLRLSKGKTLFTLILLFLMHYFCRILAFSKENLDVFMSILWIFIYLVFYFLSIQCSITKLLFILLNILNFSSFTGVLSIYFGSQKDPDFTFPYSLSYTIINFIIILFSYPFLKLLLKNKIKPLIEFSEEQKIWGYLWMIPSTFCLSYYYNLYANEGILKFSSKFSNVLFASFYLIGSFFVIYIMIKLLEEYNTSFLLKTENYHLSLQSLQYELIQQRIEDTSQATHDLHQHLTLLQSFLKDNDYKGLQEYLNEYISTLPSKKTIIYCKIYALNALIIYYETIARNNNINFNIDIKLPDIIPIKDCDIVTLFGNLLENAIEACLQVKSNNPFISLKVNQVKHNIVIVMDNSYNGTIKELNQHLLSTKLNHTGMGLISIQRITKKYNGVVKYDFEQSVFRSSIFLQP